MKLDLTRRAMEELEPIVLPDGSVTRAIAYDPNAWRMHRALDALPVGDPERGELATALLRRCVPDATADDLTMLTGDHATKILLYCRGQLDLLLTALASQGNAGAGTATASRSRRSSPPMKKRTSSRASSGTSAATGSTAGVSPTT